MSANVYQLWSEILPDVRKGVTGVGVWTALNASRPITMDGDTFVLGMPEGMSELSGHLKVPSTRRLIEQLMTAASGVQTSLRVIDGVDDSAWETAKRRDAEARKMQDAAMAKMRAEIEARTSWDGVYEQLSRRYAEVTNKSLPQNRARFYEAAVDLIAEARKQMTNYDDLSERNFARCLERVSQYTELNSTLIAIDVLRRAGEL